MIKGLILGAVTIAQLGVCVSGTARAQTVQQLDIGKTADEVCLAFEQRGSRNETEVSVGAEAKLNSTLAAYLGGLNIGASGKKKTESYQGISQQELLAALRDVRNCRLEVFKLILDKLPATAPRPAAPVVAAPTAPPPAAPSQQSPPRAPIAAETNAQPEPATRQSPVSGLRAPFHLDRDAESEPAAPQSSVPKLRAPFHLDR